MPIRKRILPEAERWLEVFKQNAEDHHDLRALGEVYNHTTFVLLRQARLKSAIHFYNKAINIFTQNSEQTHLSFLIGVCYLKQGNLDAAENNIVSLEKPVYGIDISSDIGSRRKLICVKVYKKMLLKPSKKPKS